MTSTKIFFPGSFATATCLNCKHKVDADFIKQDVLAKVNYAFSGIIPIIQVCFFERKCPGVLYVPKTVGRLF